MRFIYYVQQKFLKIMILKAPVMNIDYAIFYIFYRDLMHLQRTVLLYFYLNNLAPAARRLLQDSL